MPEFEVTVRIVYRVQTDDHYRAMKAVEEFIMEQDLEIGGTDFKTLELSTKEIK